VVRFALQIYVLYLHTQATVKVNVQSVKPNDIYLKEIYIFQVKHLTKISDISHL